MKERPILFKPEMVNGILIGQKWQTRRLVPDWQLPRKTKNNEDSGLCYMSVAQRDPRYGFGIFGETAAECMDKYNHSYSNLSPLGRHGDQLWVRESWSAHFIYADVKPSEIPFGSGSCVFYRADNYIFGGCAEDQREKKWRPSIFMPRKASRIQLEITGNRVERLCDISDDDCIAEGIESEGGLYKDYLIGTYCHESPKESYASLWQKIYGRESWYSNPWVWITEFKIKTALQGDTS